MKEKKKVEEEITKKELREQLKKWHEKRREDDADQMCFAAISLMIACQFGKIAFKENNVYFHSKRGTTYVVTCRRTTDKDEVPEKFE